MFKTKSYFGVVFVLLISLFVSSSTFAATATLSTTGSVNIDVSASGNSANIGTDTLTVNTTCSTGYTVTIQSSIDDTALYKDGDSTSNSKITPTAGTLASPLPIIGDDGNGTSYLGTWGYSMTSSAVTGTFTGLNSTPAIIKQSTTASQSGGDQFPVYYGVSVTPTLEPGAYTMANDPNNSNNPATIVYQLTMPVECQTYSIKYDANGATGSTTMSNQEIPSNATELDLWPSNYSRTGYGFAGWNTKADGTGTNYGPMETITIDSNFTNLANQDKEITLYAKWIQAEQNVTMQTWSGCGSMTNGQVIALTDTRDNNTYAIAKLADDNCWMIENLRLGGTSPITLTPADSNVISNFTLSATTDPTTTAWCETSDSACHDQSMLSSNNTTNPVANMDSATLGNRVSTGIYSLGNYYNWYSATAGTGTYSTNTNNTSVASSVCPSGWHLPKGGNDSNSTNSEFWKLGTAIMGFAPSNNSYYQNTETNTAGKTATAAIRSYPNNFLYSGYLYGSLFYNRGSGGYYWSSTVLNSNYSYNLLFGANGVRPGTINSGKYYGFSVRCVADKSASPGKIMYHENGAESPTKMSEQSASGTTATLWPSNFQHTGGDFGFAGWNTKKDGTGTSYGPMEYITLPSDFSANGLNLYAMWIPSAGNIQNWNGCSSLTTGAVTALKDTRDGNTYAIAKLADGKCWMIENLRLGGTQSITLTSADSNVASNFTLSASTDPTQTFWCSNAMNPTCTDQSMLNSTNTTNPVSNMTTIILDNRDNTGIYSFGNYYNWYSATAGTGTYSTSTNNTSVASSVCPAGWHLPKGGDKNNEANNEYWNLIVTKLNNGTNPANYSSSTYPHYYTGNPEVTDAIKLVSKYPNNFIYSGYVDGSSLYGRGFDQRAWLATASTSHGAYSLQLSLSRVFPGTDFNEKSYGLSVRCVR